jgi:hypothetical protein
MWPDFLARGDAALLAAARAAVETLSADSLAAYRAVGPMPRGSDRAARRAHSRWTNAESAAASDLLAAVKDLPAVVALLAPPAREAFSLAAHYDAAAQPASNEYGGAPCDTHGDKE